MKKGCVKAGLTQGKAVLQWLLWLVPALFFILLGAYRFEGAKMLMGRISDCFFAAGMVVGGMGGLIFASERGLFCMPRYAIGKLSETYRKSRENVDFYTYKCRHTKKRTAVSRTLFCGIIFLVISAVSSLVWSLL